MCHTHFLITFEKQITCISGRNGSGKSALMIALGILFGRRTQSLERGSSFRNLIKTGENQAIIRVVLRNLYNYKEGRYGPEIILEKQLRAHSCKLMIGRMETGTIKMRTAPTAELQNIIEHYRLRFDNPLNFMTQELSKKFLSSATPAHLYDFYYRGSEFKNIHEELDESFQRLEDMKRRLENTISQYKCLSSTLKIHKKNLEFLNVDFDILLYKLDFEESLWNLLALFDKKTRLKEERHALASRINELATRNICTAKESAAEEREKHDLENISQSIRVLRKQICEIQVDRAEYQEEYAKRMDLLARTSEMNSKNECLKRISELEQAIDDHKEKILKDENCEMNMMSLFEEAKKKRDKDRQQAYNLRNQINFLRTHATNPSTEALQRAFAAIEAEVVKTSFKDAIIGPLCNYISLKDQKWYKAASIILKKSLNSYIVFNKSDKLKLFEIFKKAGQNFTVCELSSRKMLTNYRTPNVGQLPTLLDILELKNGYVLNHLLMMHNAEQILMIDSREEAYRVIRARHPHVDSAYTLQGDRIKLVNGSLSDYKARDDGKYWFEDKQSRIKKLETMLSQISSTSEEECEAHSNQLKMLQKKIQADKEYLNGMTADRRGLEQLLSLINEEGAGNREEKEMKCEQLKKSIQALERTLRVSEEDLKEKERQACELHESIRRKREEHEAFQERMRKQSREEEVMKFKLESQIKESDRELLTLEEGILASISALRESKFIELSRDTDMIHRINGMMRVLFPEPDVSHDLPHNVSSSQITYEEFPKRTKTLNNSDSCATTNVHKSQAPAFISQSYPIIDLLKTNITTEGHNSIEEALRELSLASPKEIRERKTDIKGLQRRTQEMLSKEETEKLISRLKKEISHHKRIRDKYESIIIDTITACERRLEKRDEIKDKKTKEATELFRVFAARRGYLGELVFDHDGQLLDMNVKVHGNTGGGLRDTLSGGERSYSAVCFLLSLWRSFLCPVKVLDEFDVFMDPVNRSCAIKMIFEVLIECGTQAILITPLSMDDFRGDVCDIKVLEKIAE